MHDQNKETQKRVLKWLLRVAVTTILLGLVLRKIDLSELAQTLKTAQWPFVLVGWTLGILGYLIRSERMRFILNQLDCPLRTTKLFGVSCITALYSLILPGLFSSGVKWYILNNVTGKAARVLSAMMYNQISEFILKLVLALLALALTNPFDARWISIACVFSIMGLILFVTVLFHPRLSVGLIWMTQRLLKPFPPFFRNGLIKTINTSRVFQSSGWDFHLQIAGFNVISTLVRVLVFWSYAQALAMPVPLSAFIWQGVTIYLLAKVPITIANCGLREWTLIGFLAAYGIDATTATTFSLLVFSNALIMAAIGMFFQMLWFKEFKTVRQTR